MKSLQVFSIVFSLIVAVYFNNMDLLLDNKKYILILFPVIFALIQFQLFRKPINIYGNISMSLIYLVPIVFIAIIVYAKLNESMFSGAGSMAIFGLVYIAGFITMMIYVVAVIFGIAGILENKKTKQ